MSENINQNVNESTNETEVPSGPSRMNRIGRSLKRASAATGLYTGAAVVTVVHPIAIGGKKVVETYAKDAVLLAEKTEAFAARRAVKSAARAAKRLEAAKAALAEAERLATEEVQAKQPQPKRTRKVAPAPATA